MSRLVEIVEPDVALITNVGPSHLEFLSSVEEVARAKLEMVTASQKEIPLIINANDRILTRETNKVRQDAITFGIRSKATYMPEMIKHTPTGSLVLIEGHDFAIDLFGQHQVYNLLAAYAACRTLGYDFSKVDTSKIELTTKAMRGQIVTKGKVTIINDSYNANPESVKAGIEGLTEVPVGGRRVLILGDMLELGQESERYHREIGQFLSKHEFGLAVLIGSWSRFIIESAETWGVDDEKLYGFGNVNEAAKELKDLLKPGDLIYVKGSRGVGLEKLIDEIKVDGGSK
jgi:UDP-N-acetylmuramoyl-tripeptide--D-alanyl-D-alanine ligase